MVTQTAHIPLHQLAIEYLAAITAGELSRNGHIAELFARLYPLLEQLPDRTLAVSAAIDQMLQSVMLAAERDPTGRQIIRVSYHAAYATLTFQTPW